MFASEEKIRKVFPDYIKDYMAAQVAAFHDTFQPKDGQLNDRYYEVEGAIVDAVLDPKGVNAPLMKMRDTGSQFALVMSKVKVCIECQKDLVNCGTAGLTRIGVYERTLA